MSQVKYAMDKIFNVATKIMMGKELNSLNYNQSDNNTYLKSLDVCLKSDIGRNYLFRCDICPYFLYMSYLFGSVLK